MDYPKSVPSVGLVNGKFVDENTVSGAAGSLISASWGNAVTDELLAVIRAAQITPKEDDLDQLLEAIRYIVQNDAYTKNRAYNKEEMDALLKSNNMVPIGMMVPFPVSVIPAGFLEVDGSLQSRATYPDLAAYLGTRFNLASDPAGYFRLPESRGEFLRGWDHGRGVDSGRDLGSYQLDSLQGFRQESMKHVNGSLGNDDGGTGASGLGFAMGTAAQGTRPRNLTGAFVTDGVNGTPRVGSETRSRNLAVVWCIKAWNTSVNQGNIDIAGLAEQVQKLSVNGPVLGSTRNGKMSVSAVSSSATYVADEIVLKATLGGKSYCLSAFSKTINLAINGVGGMDAGSPPSAGFVAIYAVYNPINNLSALLAVNATSTKVSEVYGGLNMPAGYTASCLLTVVPTNTAGQFARVTVRDREVGCVAVYAYTAQVVVNSVKVAISQVPLNAVTVSGSLESLCSAAAEVGILIADGDVDGGNQQGVIGNVIAAGKICAPYSNIFLSSAREVTVVTGMTGSGTPTFKFTVSRYDV